MHFFELLVSFESLSPLSGYLLKLSLTFRSSHEVSPTFLSSYEACPHFPVHFKSLLLTIGALRKLAPNLPVCFHDLFLNYNNMHSVKNIYFNSHNGNELNVARIMID